MAEPVYVVGNTHKFKLTAQKDGSTWNLTSATVTLQLVNPSTGAVSNKAATLDTPASGIASYTTTTSDLGVAGEWKRYWKVVDGSVTLTYGPIYFTVRAVG